MKWYQSLGEVGGWGAYRDGAEPWPFWQAQSVFTWEAVHSSLLLGLMRKTQRGRKPQMRTEAVYMASCIPDCPCTCLVCPQGEWSDAPGPRTTGVHVNTCPSAAAWLTLCLWTLCRWNQTVGASVCVWPPAVWSARDSHKEAAAPDDSEKKMLRVEGWLGHYLLQDRAEESRIIRGHCVIHCCRAQPCYP